MRDIKIGLFIVVIFSLSGCKEKPMPFNKDIWLKSEAEYITDNNRYKMTLWLEKNYSFCGKKTTEIYEKFFDNNDSIRVWKKINEDKQLRIIIKQKDPNFLIGIDPWIDTDWIELYFDKNGQVSKVNLVNFNPKTKRKKEKKLCSD